MTDDANLHGTLDASVWAAEFCKRWPSAFCQIAGKEGVSDGRDFEATMIGWFANAIMTGYDKAIAAAPEVRALIREAEARGMERAAERLDLAEHDAEERDWRSGANAFATLARVIRAEVAAIRKGETP